MAHHLEGRIQPVAGPYVLRVHNRQTCQFERSEHACLEDLARALVNLAYRSERTMQLLYDAPQAYTANGKPLNVEELAAYGATLYRAYRHYRFTGPEWRGYRFRTGSVPGVGRRRGGSYFRHMHTTQERRLSVHVVYEDGEVACRPSRNFRNLPNAWDDYSRGTTRRSWKTQRKGRKSWDR